MIPLTRTSHHDATIQHGLSAVERRFVDQRLDIASRLNTVVRALNLARQSNRPHLRRVLTSMTALSHAATRRSFRPLLFMILSSLLAAGRPAAAQSLPSGVYRAGDDGVTSPRAVRQVAPGYPVEAMRAGVHGVVQMEAIVGADGSVQDVRVVKSLDRNYGLDAEAVRAAQTWRFEAGLKNGSPVPVALTIEMTFGISNEVTAANPSRLRLVLAPYNVLKKAVNVVRPTKPTSAPRPAVASAPAGSN